MYGTIAAWRVYATARGATAPALASDPLATAALLRASDYIRFSYVTRMGDLSADALLAIDEAAYIAAGYELTTPGFFSATYTEGDRKVLTEVKGIKWTVVGEAKDGRGMAPTSTLIDGLLWPYMMQRYGAVTV